MDANSTKQIPEYVFILGKRFLKLPDGTLKRVKKYEGRPLGTGKYGEPLERLYIPVSLLPRILPLLERKARAYKKQCEQIANNPLYTTPGYSWEDYI